MDAFTAAQFDAALTAFIAGAQEVMDRNYAAMPNYPESLKEKLSEQRGQRYVRIVRSNPGGEHRSVHCFVDMTNGDILKAASWKTPAKHARGNIFTVNHACEAVSPYGAHYLR